MKPDPEVIERLQSIDSRIVHLDFDAFDESNEMRLKGYLEGRFTPTERYTKRAVALYLSDEGGIEFSREQSEGIKQGIDRWVYPFSPHLKPITQVLQDGTERESIQFNVTPYLISPVCAYFGYSAAKAIRETLPEKADLIFPGFIVYDTEKGTRWNSRFKLVESKRNSCIASILISDF